MYLQNNIIKNQQFFHWFDLGLQQNLDKIVEIVRQGMSIYTDASEYHSRQFKSKRTYKQNDIIIATGSSTVGS